MTHRYFYVISAHNGDFYKIIYSDLKKTDYAVYIDESVLLRRFLWLIGKLLCHDFFPRLTNAVRSLQCEIYFRWLMKKVPEGKERYCFIIPSRYILLDGDAYIRKKYPGSKIVCFCTDLLAIHHDDEILLKEPGKVDLFYSYDPFEAAQHGMRFRNLPCSDVSGLTKDISIKYDLTFVGKDKGRLAFIQKICREMNSRGLTCNIHLINIPKNLRENIEGIHYDDAYLSYEECLKISASGRCILEIIQPNSTGNTIRVAESILLGRKLLTNNRQLPNNPYYVPENMMCFDDIGEVPSGFFRQEYNPVGERMRGSVAPDAFLQSIEDDLSALPPHPVSKEENA